MNYSGMYSFVYFLKIFWMWTIFEKPSMNLLQYCFRLMFWFFGHEACGIFAPQPQKELAPPSLEGQVPTTGSPEKPLKMPPDCNLPVIFSKKQCDKYKRMLVAACNSRRAGTVPSSTVISSTQLKYLVQNMC